MLDSETAIARKGSTLLFVLLITSMIMSFSYIFWQRSTLYVQCMYERMRYEQHICLLDGAVRYGIIYTQHKYDVLIDSTGRELNLDSYAQLMGPEYHLIIRLSPVLADRSIELCAQLYHNTDLVRTIRCTVTQFPDRKVAIDEWQID